MPEQQQQQEEEVLKPTFLQCLGALLKALFWVFMIYFVWVHFLVALKWEKSSPTWDDYTVEIMVDPEPDQVAHLMVPPANATPDLPPRESILQLIKDMEEASPPRNPAPQDKARSLLNAYKSMFKLWDKKDANHSFFPSEKDAWLSEGKKKIESLQIVRLLQRASLSGEDDKASRDSESDKKLKLLMDIVLHELQGLVDAKADVQWHSISNLLLKNNNSSGGIVFPPKEKVSKDKLFKMVCPDKVEEKDEPALADEEDLPTTTDSNDTEITNSSLYALEEDLEAHLKIIESLLDHRMTDPTAGLRNNSLVQKSLKETKKLVKGAFVDADSILNSTVQEMSEAFLESYKKANSGCVAFSEEEVVAFVDAGLNALARKQDLRDALLRVLEEIDSEMAKNMILDADLSTEAPIPERSSTGALRLRAVCDTPLVRNLAARVDRFLDIVSGYNDSFDHYIDRLTERHVNIRDPEASSLGKVFVATVLERSGHVRVQIPVSVQNWLLKTSRGRALLEFVSY